MLASQRTPQKKQRRGRPSPISEAEIFRVVSQWPEHARDRRTLYELAYMLRAYECLRRFPDAAWLTGDSARKIKLKRAILAELGHIDDGEIFLEMAVILCIIKPSALSGRRIIRQYLKYREARIEEGREWLTPSRFFASYPAVIDFFASQTSSAA